MEHDDVERLRRLAANADGVARIQRYRAVQARVRSSANPRPTDRAAADAEAAACQESSELWVRRSRELAAAVERADARPAGGPASPAVQLEPHGLALLVHRDAPSRCRGVDDA